ncbi:hypothetical protein P154DRAFT_357684 [Amniculicola lignicola CBS 123094]|uniref:HMG box domain-containing protein n=1 Tax=Amniculicola lignicola CBS 123094 TaxID=1392246 RepID=A0A6A5WUQ3_9PLEO|nr:hypothetical protein P154DRAFT_357684 [Amniculicola lignicola CBS 123094]
MLASRVLPPIYRPPPPPPPVATFYNIPRRYHRSSNMDDTRALRSLRKSNRAIDPHKAPMSNPAQDSKEHPSPLPSLSSPRVTRKRVASLEGERKTDADHANNMSDSKVPQSASSTGSGEHSGHVCLCQPEPKIPRPRNAFILYRQHHQHAIVARNPGLANPEISKIIGEQWKAEPDDQKKIWQDLAQEEKLRHHEQYPDYRYQPRRLGKAGSVSSPAAQHTTVDKYRCSRCGGRSIKTPTSPFISPAETPTLPPLSALENLTPTSRTLAPMSSLTLDSPAHRRRVTGPSNLSNIQVPPSATDTAMYSPLTPESKRRRYNYPQANNGRRSDAPYSSHSRRESLPPPPLSHLRPSPPNTGTMAPPRTPRDRRSSVDLSLLVPNQHDQSRSVEAMVMSVPYQVKIKLLGRITPPLKDPGPTSPAMQVRGAIIAVEGDDTIAIKELSGWLKDFLDKEDRMYAARISDPPKAPQETGDVAFEEYLDLIKEWHGKSREMEKFITTPSTPEPASDNGKDEVEKKERASTTSPSSNTTPQPVVILPTFQLRASDLYTSRIPIQDAYSPTDHWQWMATLWRGTVGPDLTVYVSTADPKEGTSNGKLVELDEAVRCLTVRREKGKDFDTSALRRVGFEVGEWIRGVGKKTV